MLLWRLRLLVCKYCLYQTGLSIPGPYTESWFRMSATFPSPPGLAGDLDPNAATLPQPQESTNRGRTQVNGKRMPTLLRFPSTSMGHRSLVVKSGKPKNTVEAKFFPPVQLCSLLLRDHSAWKSFVPRNLLMICTYQSLIMGPRN